MATQKNLEEKRMNLRVISGEDLTWVDIVDPTEDAKKYLAEHYNFHPLDLDDCFSRRMLPKVDEYKDYLFCIFQFPVFDKITRISSPRQWEAFVGDKYLVTLHPGSLTAPDELRRECEANEEVKKEYLSHGSGHLLYRIIDRTFDAYFPVLDKLIKLMDDLEDSVFDEEVEAAKEIGILRRDIATQRRVMIPTRTVLVELEIKLKRFCKTDMTVYWGDLMDHMNNIYNTLDEYKENIEVFKDADFVLSGYRANRAIRMLAVLLVIVLPIIIAFGAYGIYSALPAGFNKMPLAILLGIVIVVIGAILTFLKRKRII
jgi:magnesium transporter